MLNRHTDTQTTKRVASVGIGRIYATHANDAIQFNNNGNGNKQYTTSFVVPIYIAQNKCANDRPNKHNQLFEKTVSGCSNSLLF